MNLVELYRALRQLRLSGMATVLETRLRQAHADKVNLLTVARMLPGSNTTECRNHLPVSEQQQPLDPLDRR